MSFATAASWRMAGLALCAAAAAAAAPPPDARQDVHGYLTRQSFDAAELGKLEAGEVVARAFDGPNSDREIVVVSAVKIRAPRADVASYYGQMISYVDGKATQAFGRFSSPPAIDDVNTLAFDADEIDDLRSCRPGNCDIRLGGAKLESLRTAIDWSAPDYAERVNDFARKSAVAYMAAYQARGDAALVTYNDRAQPVSLKDQWLGILASSPLFYEYSPELKVYFERFPAGSLPGGRDVFYWAKENFGLAPVLSLVHGVVYDPPSRPDRTVVVQKQLYASHYHDASLAVATILDTQDAGRPASYVVYANRSRGDLLKGGFGGVKRSVVRSRARAAAEDTFGTIKRVLEAAAQGR